MAICRFAPSTTGPAHPGTLLAALLAWLDARHRGHRFILRLEDIDRERCRPELARQMIDDLEWFGLDWDDVQRQSDQRARQEAALDRLAERGLLYPSRASRAQVQASGRRTPDGGWAYDNHERERALPSGGWRMCDEALRFRLPDEVLVPIDEGGVDLAQNPSEAFGDPVVRRRDGAMTYHLAAVVDDAMAGVDRIVRGRDIAPSTATQWALQNALGLAHPLYRHHLLLLERRDRKMAKLHGSVSCAQIKASYSAGALCGFLARCMGLRDADEPCHPADLVREFSWQRIKADDQVVAWHERRLSCHAV